MPLVKSFKELNVWQRAMDVAMEVFELSKSFPAEERYSLTDQIRRSTRSVATNISEGWRKRRYVASFRSKLNDSDGEAGETQTLIEVALRCGYWDAATAAHLDRECEEVLAMLASMIRDADGWCQGFGM
jgi:four helix bundle protein